MHSSKTKNSKPTEDKRIGFKPGYKRLPFIPSEYDEYPLNVYEHRLFNHIVRRCDKENSDGCFESLKNMANFCRIGEHKARECIKLFIAARMISEEVREGCTTVYRVNPFEKWIDSGKIEKIRKSLKSNTVGRSTSKPLTDRSVPTPYGSVSTPPYGSVRGPLTDQSDEGIPIKEVPIEGIKDSLSKSLSQREPGKEKKRECVSGNTQDIEQESIQAGVEGFKGNQPKNSSLEANLNSETLSKIEDPVLDKNSAAVSQKLESSSNPIKNLDGSDVKFAKRTNTHEGDCDTDKDASRVRKTDGKEVVGWVHPAQKCEDRFKRQEVLPRYRTGKGYREVDPVLVEWLVKEHLPLASNFKTQPGGSKPREVEEGDAFAWINGRERVGNRDEIENRYDQSLAWKKRMRSHAQPYELSFESMTESDHRSWFYRYAQGDKDFASQGTKEWNWYAYFVVNKRDLLSKFESELNDARSKFN